MYYLIIDNLGMKKCIHKSPQNIYTNNMHIGCAPSFTYSSNIQLIATITINCTGTANTIQAGVFADYKTYVKFNLV
jgi:hypothetical protein